jgi:hypothetical protein
MNTPGDKRSAIDASLCFLTLTILPRYFPVQYSFFDNEFILRKKHVNCVEKSHVTRPSRLL